MKILALDFDGVLNDSTDDAIVTSFNAYHRLFPGTQLFNSQKLIYDNYHAVLEEHKELVKKFMKLGRFLKAGADYVLGFKILEEDSPINAIEEFQEYKQRQDQNLIKNMDKAFYEVREQLIKEDINKWHALFKPYQEAVDKVSALSSLAKIVIVTSKNKDAVERVLSEMSYDFEIEDILAKEQGASKPEKIKDMSEIFGVKYSDIVFVDDVLINLTEVKKLGVSCFLAMWKGTNTEKDEDLAKSLDIGILTLKNLEKELSKALKT